MGESLAGKVVIITGASSGIGEAVAWALAGEGCRLSLAARSVDKMEALAAGLGTESLVVGADMRRAGDIRDMVARTVERFGRVDVLFANAGVFVMGEFMEGDVEAYSDLLRVNVDGVMRCMEAVIPTMRAQGGGDILVTSSIAGHEELHMGPVYGASKHAVRVLVHTLRRQLAGDGIRVMSLAPGRVANALWGLVDEEEIGRLAEEERLYLRSEDVAEAALFMLSRPRHVTARDMVILPQKQDV